MIVTDQGVSKCVAHAYILIKLRNLSTLLGMEAVVDHGRSSMVDLVTTRLDCAETNKTTHVALSMSSWER